MKQATVALLLAFVSGAFPARAADIHDTRLLSDPALSANRIAFAYANDLWTAALDGRGVERLTSAPGVESGPKFSGSGRASNATAHKVSRDAIRAFLSSAGRRRPNSWPS